MTATTATYLMAAIYLAVLAVPTCWAIRLLVKDLTRKQRSKEHMAYLREQARREGRYEELPPEN